MSHFFVRYLCDVDIFLIQTALSMQLKFLGVSYYVLPLGNNLFFATMAIGNGGGRW